MRLTFDAEPVTGSRFVERPFRPYWQRCDNLENAFEFHIVDTSDQDKIINNYLLAPLDPFRGPQVKVGLFHSDFDTLCIKMSHIVADGGALIEYLQLLSSIYRRLKEEPKYRPISNLHGSRSSFQVLRHVGLTKILSSCMHLSVFGAVQATWKFPAAGNDRPSPSFFVRRIEPERVSRIKAYARNHGVTIGDVLITAYYRALFEVLDPPENVPLPLFIPVNLRKYIPGGVSEGICSLTAAYFPKIIRKKAEPFEETLDRVHAVMESEKSKQKELGLLFLMEVALAFGYVVPRILAPFLSSVSVVPEFTSLGILNTKIANFRDAAVREILMAGAMSLPTAPTFGIVSSTFNGEMILESTVRGTEAYKVKVVSLIEKLIRELPEYRQNEPARKNITYKDT